MLGLAVAALTIMTSAVAVGLSVVFILLGLLALPVAVGLIARPPLALGVIFFCFFTNAQQVLALWHGFDYLTELLFLLLLGVLARDLWFGGLPGPRAGPFAALLILNAAYLAGQVPFSAVPSVALLSVEEVAKHGLIALLMVMLLTDRARLSGAGAGIVVALLLMAGITVVQYQYGLYHQSFGGFGAVTFHNIVGEIDFWRVDGPLTDPNFYAQVLLISLPFAFAGLSSRAPTHWRLVCLAALALGLAAIMLTYSRGALVGLAALGVALNLRRWPFIVGAVTLFAVVALVTDIPYFERIAAAMADVFSLLTGAGYLQDAAISGRLSEMLVALHLFLEHPLTGAGIGQYEDLYQDTARQLGLMARGADREAHSLILELLAERGLIGSCLYLLLVAGAVHCLVQPQGPRGRGRPMARALLYSLLAYYVTSLFLHEAFPMYFWLLVALCFAVRPAPHVRVERAVRPVVLVSWDYDEDAPGEVS